MNHLPFAWTGQIPLAAELGKPIERISIELGFGSVGRPQAVTLWRPDSTGLQICSEMHDIAERLEVGVLSFSPISTHTDAAQFANAPASFKSNFEVFKMVIDESDTTAESGLVIRAVDGHELIVVASASPCYLWTSGVFVMENNHIPEYPLDQYVLTNVERSA